MEKKRLIVIGGGAAGFFCAVNAAKKNPSIEVLLLERSGKLLSKVRISGGGRCNVTHRCFSVTEMVKKYPRGDKFLKQAFHRFFTNDTIEWFENSGVRLKSEPDGRMFPESDSSESIINCLLKEAARYQVQIMMNRQVVQVEKKVDGTVGFRIGCKDGSSLEAHWVCIASGGFSKPEQYGWLTGLGHSIEPPVPSLFTFNVPGDSISRLMGISVEPVRVKIAGTKFVQDGSLLITHWGFSGPAVLKLSAFAATTLAALNYQFKIVINWLAGFNENSLLENLKAIRQEQAARKMINRNPFGIPQRLWEYHLRQCGIDAEVRWADLPGKQQNLLSRQLCAQSFDVMGKTTFKEEFVTAGGIRLQEVNPLTMQSKIVAGLYFAGEVLDVDGITGGFNFQHAWTSGWIAADSITGGD